MIVGSIRFIVSKFESPVFAPQGDCIGSRGIGRD